MTNRLLGNSIPLPYLRRKELQNGQPAKAEIPRVLGGNVRFLHEWTTGDMDGWDGSTATDPPCAPVTGNVPHESSGLSVSPGPGHDHSGGMMGVPFVRTVWLTTYGEINNGQLGGEAIANTVTSSRPSIDLCNTAVSALWIPWCMSDGCYNSLAWRAWLHTTATVNYAVTLENAIDRHYATGTMTGAAYQRITISREISFRPGRFNHFRCKINISRTGGADSTVHCLAWGLFQIKTDP